MKLHEIQHNFIPTLWIKDDNPREHEYIGKVKDSFAQTLTCSHCLQSVSWDFISSRYTPVKENVGLCPGNMSIQDEQ